MPRKRSRSSESSVSSSSGGNELAENKKKNSKSISRVMPSDSSSSSDDDDGEWNAKPKVKSKSKRNKKTKKMVKPPKKKSKNSVIDNDGNHNDLEKNRCREEKEEGEIDFSDENEEFNDGFDENLLGDEEDQKKLAQMTEKEREQELFNRSEKREVLRTRFEIERKLRLAKKQEMQKKTPEKPPEKSTDTAYTDSASRSIERRRNMEDKRKVKDAMKGLKAEREKKKEKMKQKLKATDIYSDSSESEESNSEIRTTKKGIKKSSTSEFTSTSSMSDDSDVDSKNKSDRKRDNNDWDQDRLENIDDDNEQFDFNIEHLNSIRLSRYKMEKWCHAPFFKNTVLNAFVRIGIGNNSISQYIVGQIVDVVETPKIYLLGKTRTNKGLKLKYANSPEKVFRLEYVSNSEFTPNEFEQWYSKMVNNNCDFPTKELVERKKSDIQKAINYNYSEQDIELIVAEKERFKKKPINFAMKKTQLLKEKEYAEMNGDHEKAIEIGKEIDRLEEESKKLEKVRTQSIASISFINERNRMRNIKEAERAIAEAAKEAQNNKDDPFTRRKCTPTMIHVFNKNKQLQNENPPISDNDPNLSSKMDSNEGDLLDSGSLNKNTAIQQNNYNNGNKSTDNKQNESEDANDMFSVHNFDIKIDFENLDFGLNNGTSSSISNQNSSFSNSFLSGFSNSKPNGFSSARSNPISNSGTNRRSLNLDEYKKKKGLI